jgi:hypothetical protein
LIKQHPVNVLDNTGLLVFNPNVFTADPRQELDNNYPFTTVSATKSNDSPEFPLNQSQNNTYSAEIIRSFSARTYLMWDPTLMANGAGGCSAASRLATVNGITANASTCDGSIPVPLGSVPWSFSGDAINTLNTQPAPNPTTFVLGCGNNTVNPAFNINSSFPEWGTTLNNGIFHQTFTCH